MVSNCVFAGPFKEPPGVRKKDMFAKRKKAKFGDHDCFCVDCKAQSKRKLYRKTDTGVQCPRKYLPTRQELHPERQPPKLEFY